MSSGRLAAQGTQPAESGLRNLEGSACITGVGRFLGSTVPLALVNAPGLMYAIVGLIGRPVAARLETNRRSIGADGSLSAQGREDARCGQLGMKLSANCRAVGARNWLVLPFEKRYRTPFGR